MQQKQGEKERDIDRTRCYKKTVKGLKAWTLAFVKRARAVQHDCVSCFLSYSIFYCMVFFFFVLVNCFCVFLFITIFLCVLCVCVGFFFLWLCIASFCSLSFSQFNCFGFCCRCVFSTHPMDEHVHRVFIQWQRVFILFERVFI